MSAEGAVSKLGADAGQDELVEGQRSMCHKLFTVHPREGLVPHGGDQPDSEGCTTLRVRCVRELPPDEAVGLLQGDDSTGLMVWDAGQLMTRHIAGLAQAGAPAMRRLVELGGGIGLTAVAAATLLHETHLLTTDGNDECVEAALLNIDMNRTSAGLSDAEGSPRVVAQQLMYGDDEDVGRALLWCGPGGADAVMASDVIYHEEVVAPLFETAARLLRAGQEEAGCVRPFLLSYVPRAWSSKENADILRLVMATASEVGFAEPEVLASKPVIPPDGSQSELTNTLFRFDLLPSGGGDRGA